MMFRIRILSALLPILLFSACAPDGDIDSALVGSETGGASGVGAGGDSQGSGGDLVGAGGTGVGTETGGNVAVGGSPAVGGDFSSGGDFAAAGGSSAGGGLSSGGTEAAGGGLASGGSFAAGGNAAAGGDSAVGGTASGGNGNSTGGSSPTGGVFPDSVVKPKIMIVGDSISAGSGCYKGHLYDDLVAAGITNFEFVGEYSDACGSSVRHSAVSCSTAENYTNATFTMSNCSQGQSFPGVSKLMPSHNPDMVMLQLGVNDMWGGNTPYQTVLGRYETLIGQMRAHNPRIVVVVAQIHKINTINCSSNGSGYDPSAEALVNAVPAWAATMNSADSPVFVADLWTNSFVTETSDCVHPDAAGAERMGGNWFNAIADLLR